MVYDCRERRDHGEYVRVIIQARVLSNDLSKELDQLFVLDFDVAIGILFAFFRVIRAAKSVSKLLPRRLVKPARFDDFFFEVPIRLVPLPQYIAIPTASFRLFCRWLLFSFSVSNGKLSDRSGRTLVLASVLAL